MSVGTIRWRCVRFRSYGCNAAMTTDNKYPYKNPRNITEHCHPPNEFLKRSKDIKLELRKLVRESPDVSIAQVVKDVFQHLSEEEKVNLGNLATLKRDLRRVKQAATESKAGTSTPPRKIEPRKKSRINTIKEIELKDDGLNIDEHFNSKTIPEAQSEQNNFKIDKVLEGTQCDNTVEPHAGTKTDGNALQQLSQFCFTSNKPKETHASSRLQPQGSQVTQDKVRGNDQTPSVLCRYELPSQFENVTTRAYTWHRPPHTGPATSLRSPLRVDSEVANKVDLHSMTSSMNRARKSGSAKKVDAQEVQGSVNVDGGPSTSTSIPQYPIPDFSASTSITQLGSPEPSTSASNTHVMLPEPSPSTSGTNDAPPEVPELFESHMYISENSMSFAEEMPASIQNKEGEVGKETATSNTCPTDKIQTPTEIMSSVKVKPLDTLQANEARSSNRTSEQNVKTANIDVSAKTLESAIRRLELVSSKLTAVSLFDSYDHFGKYVSSVLRGLPAKKVLSLKQKIISEVMQVLSQEETNSAKQGTEDSQSQNPDVGSSTKRFVAEQPQAVNLPSDPNSFALRTSVGGNVSMLYPAMYTSTPTIVAQVPFFATNIVSATSTSTLSLPDNGFITSSTPNPMVRPPLRCTKTILQCPRGRGRKRRGTPVTYSNNKRPSYETTSHTVVTPKDGTTGEEQLPKSLDEQKLQEVLKLGSRLHENSEFSERRDEEVTNEDEDLSNSQQEFEIDIEEGTELAEMKQDQQDSFETVLCEGGSDLYIKEEPPEADLTSVTATPASASSTTSAVTCNLCSERCGSREHLLAHLCSAHPGCNVAQSGYFAT